MKPDVSQILFGALGTMASGVAPHLAGNTYATGNANIITMLMMLVAQEAGRTADTLARENAAIRSLFADAAAAPLDGALATRIAAAAKTADPSLIVADLEAANAALRRDLIALHAAVEDAGGDWAVAMDRRIWTILTDGAERRVVALPG